jgi:hypothetical protein
MAITLTKVADGENVIGRHKYTIYDVALDASYPAGGYVIAAGDVGLKFLFGVITLAELPANATTQTVTVKDLGGVTKVPVLSLKIRTYVAGTETTTGGSLATVGYRFLFLGE